MNELDRQLIFMYTKQLRILTFNQYEEVIWQLNRGKEEFVDDTGAQGLYVGAECTILHNGQTD